MSELEFDLLAKPYAKGFGQALTTYLGEPVSVHTERRNGHLYSALVSRGESERRNLLLAYLAPDAWQTTVLPEIRNHFEQLLRWRSESPAVALRQAASLFARCIELHHLLLLPARQAMSDFRVFCETNAGAQISSLVPLNALLLEQPLPMLRSVARLVDMRERFGALSDDERIDLVNDGAPDGDGYGVAQPGWLGDRRYVRRVERMLRRFRVDQLAICLIEASAKARRDHALALLRLAVAIDKREQFESLLLQAQAGATAAEIHGPIMHVRYMHELRCLALSIGRRLVDDGQLNQPDDIFHLAFDELAYGWKPSTIDSRRAEYEQQLQFEPPATGLQLPIPDDAKPLSEKVQQRLRFMSCDEGSLIGQAEWRGVPASSGQASGPLRVLRSQADFAAVRPGEVALVPDAGPAWGWLTFGVAALVVEHGSPLGHAPSIARQLGRPCIVSASGLASLLADGQHVDVCGDSGRVSW
jgi:phosphohistidine swiveling domain-containing protein